MSAGVLRDVPAIPPMFAVPPRLSTKKDVFIAAMTIAAWDILSITPTSRKIFSKHRNDWPLLKTLFLLIMVLLLSTCIITSLAFFYAGFTHSDCERYVKAEPIIFSILLSLCSAAHFMRIKAIFSNSWRVVAVMAFMLAQQVVVTATCCAFFERVPVIEGQGCFTGPKAKWVGISWISTTVFYSASAAFALYRSFESQRIVQASWMKLIIRDSLLCYIVIACLNLLNVLIWFIAVPYDPADTITTTTTSATVIMTSSMTLRMIVQIRGNLHDGGKFAVPRVLPAVQTFSREPAQGPRSALDVQSIELGQREASSTDIDAKKFPRSPWTIDVAGDLQQNRKGDDAVSHKSDTASSNAGTDGVSVLDIAHRA